MPTTTFIKMDRSFLEWRMYKNVNTRIVFEYLIMKANYKPHQFEQHIIGRGQLVTSIRTIANDNGISEKAVRTALKNLQNGGEISSKSFARYRIVTIVKYDEYQNAASPQGASEAACGLVEKEERAGSRQAQGRLAAGSRQAQGNNIRKKESKNERMKEKGERAPFAAVFDEYESEETADNSLLQADALCNDEAKANMKHGLQGENKIDYAAIVALYNETCTSLPRVQNVSESRKKAIKARMREGYTREDFETLFQKTQQSAFLTGNNNRNWSASFDWLLKEANMAKVLDGNYDSREKPEPSYNYDYGVEGVDYL